MCATLVALCTLLAADCVRRRRTPVQARLLTVIALVEKHVPATLLARCRKNYDDAKSSEAGAVLPVSVPVRCTINASVELPKVPISENDSGVASAPDNEEVPTEDTSEVDKSALVKEPVDNQCVQQWRLLADVSAALVALLLSLLYFICVIVWLR